MKCPKCNIPLQQVYMQEVPIEQCSTCQGIWLDSGEYDLIAQREKTEEGWLSKAFRSWLESSRKKASVASTSPTESPALRPPMEPTAD